MSVVYFAPFRLQSIPVLLKKISSAMGFLGGFFWSKNELMVELRKPDHQSCLGGIYLTSWQS